MAVCAIMLRERRLRLPKVRDHCISRQGAVVSLCHQPAAEQNPTRRGQPKRGAVMAMRDTPASAAPRAIEERLRLQVVLWYLRLMLDRRRN